MYYFCIVLVEASAGNRTPARGLLLAHYAMHANHSPLYYHYTTEANMKVSWIDRAP
ncbi:protein of unknown function [Candidatus Nitrosocaldus cavascurensis]|uniref:Uncharacterized protein n=1 Tax=Candidatus Nitrosocaldus cavascurensis TaxID=2058097 RepID=A0A2K5AQZ7_9ARCH|nr:protein of unknown function [Candidatus Nitrosocaldus cavascurensis]